MYNKIVKESQIVTSYMEDDGEESGYVFYHEDVKTPEGEKEIGPFLTLIPSGETLTFNEDEEEYIEEDSSEAEGECEECEVDSNEEHDLTSGNFSLDDLFSDDHVHYMDLVDFDEDGEEDDLVVTDLLNKEVESISEKIEDNQEDELIPGSDVPVSKAEDKVEVKETDWKNDKDSSKFMEYIQKAYKDIPRHDGKSTIGCERAIKYLNGLNKEISEAIRVDNDGALNDHISELENYRSKIIKDVMTLKNHIKKLNQEVGVKKASNEQEEIIKEATVPKINVVATPFERAIAGIIINSVVSAGNTFDEVYDFLKKKYKLTERDELSIMQLLRDMGHPIFADRGAIGGDSTQVDFAKNYFA